MKLAFGLGRILMHIRPAPLGCSIERRPTANTTPRSKLRGVYARLAGSTGIAWVHRKNAPETPA